MYIHNITDSATSLNEKMALPDGDVAAIEVRDCPPVYVCVYVRTYILSHGGVVRCVHLRIHVGYIVSQTYTYIFTCVYTYIHVCVCVYIYVYTHRSMIKAPTTC